MEKKLLLASGSPRRKELLTLLGYHFDVIRTDVEEQQKLLETPRQYVERLSKDKALAGLQIENEAVVIGSDTIVVCDSKVLEKPSNFEHAKQMLMTLSNRAHQVMTAVTIVSREQQHTVVVTTDVWFKRLSEEEIEQYWQTGEPCDKAGGYGIQGIGGRFVIRIEGSYHAVVGLPLFETDQLLHKFL
ncbi:Maf-like protein [Vibrio zhanjiangensis]|uniref:dTTP/UTP pyrophosphatase n=1 Tax=Vibrio zhanjiangensis TaxID=1046128 RepID=A0ABQ6EVV5_9VIBR|nr:nucleoside triphosphate pyrophosphatase [Vibrio zhanjiangensis]GLT17124.1 Maf-like protein [Vibrio zhanjiangensis]